MTGLGLSIYEEGWTAGREQGISQGISQGIDQMISYVLQSTHSIKKTAETLGVDETKVRRVAKKVFKKD